MEHIRNFCIIAHIDHGKSTLADRFLEITKTVDKRHMRAQYLDQLDLERERGITIKMAPVRMVYHSNRGLTQKNTRTNAENDLLYEDLTYRIRGCVFAVRKNLGLGHKELIYQKALAIEFEKTKIPFEREKTINVKYNDKPIGVYRPDFVINEKVILELKSLPFLGQTEEKQFWSYIKGSSYKLGLLVNFGGKDVEIKRVIYDNARLPRESASSQRESANSEEYILNLIDTPGHSDFGYEVSRALAAVEGGILLVDATQGIQAQTLANFRAARASGLTLIGAINKIDLFKNPGDQETIARLREEVAELLETDARDILLVSGKTGDGVEELLNEVIRHIPPPEGPHRLFEKSVSEAERARLPEGQSETESQVGERNAGERDPVFSKTNGVGRALVFDSFYDDHKGVMASVRVFDGEIDSSQNIYLAAPDIVSKIKEVGYFKPQVEAAATLKAGEIGYIATGIKDTSLIKIGDTALTNFHKSITNNTNITSGIRGKFVNIRDLVLPGYKEPKSVVFVSFYPEENDGYELLKKSLEKLKLNDSALTIEPDQNEVLGRGYKVGFLGRLHFEITAERLKREYKVGTVSTFPSVIYKVKTKKGWQTIIKPEELPAEYEEIWEPMTNITILVPPAYSNNIFPLQSRFRFSNITTRTFQDQMEIKAAMPLAELVSDFDDQLKSATAGFASFSYELADYAKADIVKTDILVAGDMVPGLSRFFPTNTVEKEARRMVEKLKEILPRQQFAQPIQARVNNKFIAREDIPAMRKDVTGYLYGGDRTRKMKLWSKQKKGKKKLQSRAQVRITPAIFKELIKK